MDLYRHPMGSMFSHGFFDAPMFPTMHPLFSSGFEDHHRPQTVSNEPIRGFAGERPQTVSNEPIRGFDAVTDGDDGFEVCINAAGFAPEDIKIEFLEGEGVLVVAGKTEEKGNGSNSSSTREFRRSYNIPSECDPKKMESRFSKDSILKIYAPKVRRRIQNCPQPQMAPPPTAMSGPKKVPHVRPRRRSLEDQQLPKNHLQMNARVDEVNESARIFNNFSCGQASATEDGDAFRVSVDVDGFAAAELSVEVAKDGVMTVSGKHSEGGANAVTRKFSRQFQIPESCDADAVTSRLSTATRTLVVEAPKKRPDVKKIKVEVRE